MSQRTDQVNEDKYHPGYPDAAKSAFKPIAPFFGLHNTIYMTTVYLMPFLPKHQGKFGLSGWKPWMGERCLVLEK